MSSQPILEESETGIWSNLPLTECDRKDPSRDSASDRDERLGYPQDLGISTLNTDSKGEAPWAT